MIVAAVASVLINEHAVVLVERFPIDSPNESGKTVRNPGRGVASSE